MVMANAPTVSESTLPRTQTADDHAFAVFCETGALALMMFAAMSGAPTMQAARVHTGYMPKAQRTALAASHYSNGFRVAPKRETADDRAKAEARKWGLAS